MKIGLRAMALLMAALMMAMGAMALAEPDATVEPAAAAEAAEPEGAEAAPQTGWREGLGPQKPYEGVPEVDLSERLGYMIFFPSSARTVENACKKLFVYLPRTDVKAGEGKFYLCSEEDGELWRTTMNDPTAVTCRDLTDAERNSLMWGEGKCFEITLPQSLTLGQSYFVNMERGCIVTEDGRLDNPEVGGTQTWAFALEGNYGVNGMEYRRVEPESIAAAGEDGEAPEPEYVTVLAPAAGDGIRFDVVLGGEAAMAVLYGYFDTVDFQQTLYEESCEVTGTVMKESPAWGVMFLDAQGNELNRVEFY